MPDPKDAPSVREVLLRAVTGTANGPAIMAEFDRIVAHAEALTTENARLVKAWEDRDHERFLQEERAEVAEAHAEALEAALREIAALDGGYPDDYCSIARAALTGPGEPERHTDPWHTFCRHTAQPTPSHVCGYGRCNTYRPPGGKNPYEAQPTPSPEDA